MTELTCGWCGFKFNRTIIKSKIDDERNILTCPNCARVLPSSKKSSTGNVVGRKHTHREYRDGDVA